MKRSLIAATVVCLGFGTAIAEVAPLDVVFEDGAVTASLTGAPGDPANGRKVFANRKLGNCLACHANADQSDQLFHGEIAPSLDGVGANWEEAALRGILVNSKNVFEGTIMPGFYTTAGFTQVASKFDGLTILTAQEVEDVLAYLLTLTE